MMTHNATLEQVIKLSHRLGRPEMDCVILGEGNTSARADENSFWVKSSGARLAIITASGFVRVVFSQVESLLSRSDLSDQDVKMALENSKADSGMPGHPSVETLLHAILLKLEGVHFVGHTHPTAINALSCSNAFPEAFSGRLFPDEIVLCGVAPMLVPYTDPGIPLARMIGRLLEGYLDIHGEPPRIVIMQNHGLIALGSTAQQVEDVTMMANKTARILLGAYKVGGPHFLSEKDVARIHTRPDELYRKQKLGLET